jgi:hypothetical protein
LIGTSPTFEALALDLVAKDLPILEAKELTKRLRKQMINQGVVDPSDEEIQELGLDQETPPDPQQVAITDNINMQTEKLMSDIENQDADTISKQIKSQQDTVKTYETMIKTLIEQLQAGIPLSVDDHNMRLKQQDIIEEGQQAIDEGPNREQAQSIVQDAQAQGIEPEGAPRLTVEQPSASVGQDIVS